MASADSVTEGDLWFERRHGSSRGRVWQDVDSPFSRRSSTEAEEDDLEALTWAAMERLPTYMAMLEEDTQVEAQNSRSGAGERSFSGIIGRKKVLPVDVRHLHKAQRQRLLEKAFATTDQDNAILLQRLKQRIDR